MSTSPDTLPSKRAVELPAAKNALQDFGIR